jgi:adenylosuccinate synthase
MFELHDMIKKIQHTWVPARLKELRISEDSFEGEDAEKAHLYFSMFRINAALYADELKNDARLFFVEDPKYFIDPAQELIVEGAQGLMLDEYLGKFPHVTRSVTGLSSSIAAAYECGYTSVQPIYVTRAYLTRHGNGPLPNEGEAITHKPLLDYTNVPNPWQGTLRYAPLNIDELKRFIELDYIRGQASAHLTSTAIAKPLIFLTCMDQLGESVQVEVNRGLEIIPSHMLPALLKSHLKMEVPFISTGPFAQDVQFRAKVL